jgi:hypothetical protein
MTSGHLMMNPKFELQAAFLVTIITMAYVYGIAIYDEETGYQGMNTWNVYGTVERACSNIENMLELNDSCVARYLSTDIDKVKIELESKGYATYTKSIEPEHTLVYAVVRLKAYD